MCFSITHIFVMTVRVYEGVSLRVCVCLCVCWKMELMNVFNCTDMFSLKYVCVRVCVHLYGKQECPFPIQHVCMGSGLCSGLFPPLYTMPLSPSWSLYNPSPPHSSFFSFQGA